MSQLRLEPASSPSKARPGRIRTPVHAWSLRLPKRRSQDVRFGPSQGSRLALFFTDAETPNRSTLVCVDLSTGRPRWSATVGRFREATADSRNLYVLSHPEERRGRIQAFDWATGRVVLSHPASWLGGGALVTDGHFLLWSEGQVDVTVALDLRSQRELWRRPGVPLALVHGLAYLWTWGSNQVDDGQHVAAVDPKTGRKVRDSHYSTTIAVDYTLSDFHWFETHRRFVAQERLRGYTLGLRAWKPDLSPAWSLPDADSFGVGNEVLVSQLFERTGSKAIGELKAVGLLAQDPATGRKRWSRPDLLDAVLGTSAERVVVGGMASLNERGALYRGLRPADGLELWSVRLPVIGAQVIDKWLVGTAPIVGDFDAGVERVECYRLP